MGPPGTHLLLAVVGGTGGEETGGDGVRAGAVPQIERHEARHQVTQEIAPGGLAHQQVTHAPSLQQLHGVGGHLGQDRVNLQAEIITDGSCKHD